MFIGSNVKTLLVYVQNKRFKKNKAYIVFATKPSLCYERRTVTYSQLISMAKRETVNIFFKHANNLLLLFFTFSERPLKHRSLINYISD